MSEGGSEALPAETAAHLYCLAALQHGGVDRSDAAPGKSVDQWFDRLKVSLIESV